MRRVECGGVVYETLRQAQATRRERYLTLMKSGMNSTAPARAVGVSKRTAKVWRNGRTRSTEGEHVRWDTLRQSEAKAE